MKHGAPDHRKMKAFAAEIFGHLSSKGLAGAVPIRLCLTIANGTMERLWKYANEYLHDGDLSRLTPALLADELGWAPEDAGWLIETLVRMRLLDRAQGAQLRIHDWHDHAEDSIHRQLWRARARFADGRAPKIYTLPERERTEAIDFYGAHVSAEPARKPRSRGRNGGKRGQVSESARADCQSAQGQTVNLPAQSAENVPPLPSPPPASPQPPPASASASGAPADDDGDGGALSPGGPERELARRELRARPWPDVSPTKADALVAAHPPAAILAAVSRAKAQGGRLDQTAAGVLVRFIERGDGEKLLAEQDASRKDAERRQTAAAWWAQAPPDERARVCDEFRARFPTARRASDFDLAGTPALIGFIVDRLRAEAVPA